MNEDREDPMASAPEGAPDAPTGPTQTPTPTPTPTPSRSASTASALPGFLRGNLQDGSMIALLRASAPAGMKLRTDAELDSSLDEVLKGRDPDADVHVFAYGSLMWNPALEFIDSARADLRGWSRKFCILLSIGRGTPEQPGLMLGLDRGGMCRGMVFTLAAARAREELRLLWRREMLGTAYQPRWVTVTLRGVRVRALTFVVDRTQDRYAGRLSASQAAQLIATGKGSLGSCVSYFQTTIDTLASLGIKDAGMERLRKELALNRPVDEPPAKSA